MFDLFLEIFPADFIIIYIIYTICSLICIFITYKSIYILDYHSQLKITTTGLPYVLNGPGIKIIPFWASKIERRITYQLSNSEYLFIENTLTGDEYVKRGPNLIFLGPTEEVIGNVRVARTLEPTEYIHIQSKLTGEKRMILGPTLYFPNLVSDEIVESGIGSVLSLVDYCKLRNMKSGDKWLIRGPSLVFPKPDEVVDDIGSAWALKKNEYIRLIDQTTGEIRVEIGEALVFPTVYEEVLGGEGVMTALSLKQAEYVKILNRQTGKVRVESGPQLVYLGKHDEYLTSKKHGVACDDQTAVLVKRISDGYLFLFESDKEVYIPSEDEEINEIRKRINLASHEAMIIKNRLGEYEYHYGSNSESSHFFLMPHCEIVKLYWSHGRKRAVRDLVIDVFDCRPHYMSFEFSCRTQDNVELILEGTFFWEVVDLPLMVSTTGDAPGDICNFARSSFIQFVSRVTLAKFMDTLHEIAGKVYTEYQHMYESRGIKIHSLEITRYQCADVETECVLKNIIQETTNRMNRLSQQESENEVNIFKMKGDIEVEKMCTELNRIRQEHELEQAKSDGRALSSKFYEFAEVLSSIMDNGDILKLLGTNIKHEDFSMLCEKARQVSLFYTPDNLELSLKP